MPEVTCLGILVADLVGKPIDEYPQRGRLALVKQMELHGGGCAMNTGISLAKLGINTALMGKVGSDGLGDFLINSLERNGVNSSGVKRDDKINTSASMVIVHSDGERSFLHHIGANAALVYDDVDFELIRNSSILHIAGGLVMPGIDGEPTAEILKQAQSMGVTTCYDTVWNAESGWMEKIKPTLPYLDYFLPSVDEARMITGKHDPSEVAQVLLDNGVKVVALKMGEMGSFVKSADFEKLIPTFMVNAIDGTGSGDAYVAGFLAAIVKGWDLERAGRFANMVGACCVEALGATNGIRSMEETLARFSE